MSLQLGDSMLDEGSDTHPARRYRAVSPAALASLVLGVLSAVTFLSWYLAIIPAVGLGVGWLAQRRIRDNPEELTGLGFAWTGLGLSLGFWVLAYAWMLSARIREVPYGYDRVEYEDLQPEPSNPDEVIPPSALRFQDRKVFIKGYMAPTRRQTGLKRFVLCPAMPNCPFCPANPKPTEMILVTLTGDLEADYTTNLVRLAGTFKIDPAARTGIPYALEADFVR
jgi:hypothetical protein